MKWTDVYAKLDRNIESCTFICSVSRRVADDSSSMQSQVLWAIRASLDVLSMIAASSAAIELELAKCGVLAFPNRIECGIGA